ncbi:NADH-quinone oxidoreductase subunit J [Thalassotalea mangrovi]|uniref:NADH-quinone oxidoreductase subunit J n=1 Tax=Thalassotalea mangrovi TaxID=2572245 RepID=A0A4U1B1W1_9GAMM|nr:NADH-quinone oxidoreductase subunit J [Thalassotalea mangrovi]TKB43471.1 NADH-quinone oxidoreductase subunit J [Thalassotalea mangrovi]
MDWVFYFAALVAFIASIKVVTSANAIHALLYLVVSLLAVAFCFYLLGAPFAAGLEVIVYAGAILVLFVFAVMMFDLQGDNQPVLFQQSWLATWFGPLILTLTLAMLLAYILVTGATDSHIEVGVVSAKQVGIALYGPYLLAVEIASFLLLAGLLAGYHFAKSTSEGEHR